MDCPICYEKISTSTGTTTLSCSHSFHFGCLSGWFLKQEVGTCPCCRKEMTATEDLPRDADESEDDDSDDDESDDEYDEGELEVPFDREKLGEFLKERGGVGMKDTISTGWDDATTVTFTRTQLHFLFIGNGAKPFTDEEWEAIIEDDEDEDEDEVEEGEMPETLRITIDDNSRTVMFASFEDMALDAEAIAAATKFQSLWRAHKARETVMEKRAIHTLASLRTRNFLSA